MLLLGTGSPNMGLEFGIGKKYSLSLDASYNPFKFSELTFWKHVAVQPEFRWWLCHRYAGSFLGTHALYSHFNVSAPSLGLDYRYQGDLAGAGVAYGYSWMLGKRWNIEAVIGGGFVHLRYDKYECKECGDRLGTYKRNYLGVTKAAISLIYHIK